MVMIPVGIKYTATVEGKLPKAVKCEGCGQDYVYLLEGWVEGSDVSILGLNNEGAQQSAQAMAEAALRADLAKGCAVVPCPACGLVQQHMVALARSERLPLTRTSARGLLFLGGLMVLASGIMVLASQNKDMGIVALAIWIATGALLTSGAILALVRWSLTRRYDPNSVPVEQRKQLGQQSAWTREAFEKAFAADESGAG
jgi:hypothetical protein